MKAWAPKRAARSVAVLFLVLGGCVEEGPADPIPAAPCPPATPDSFHAERPAGTRSWGHSYALPWDGSTRTLDIHLWYPTAQSEGEATRWLDIFPDPWSWVNATFDPPDDRCLLPLVVYSHGSQAWGGSGSDLMRQLAGSGFVVAAPDHTGNTIADNLDPRPAIFPLVRVEDVRAAIDLVQGLPEGDPLYGRVDTNSVIVVGHSFGGQTAWFFAGPTFDAAAIDQRCAEGVPCTDAERAAYGERPFDPRVAGVAPLAGDAGDGWVSDEGWATMDRPVLYMTGTEDFDGAPQFGRTSEGDVRWVELDGACHESFTSTDVPCATLDKEEGLEVVDRFLRAFVWQVALGAEGPGIDTVLDGTEEVSERATLRTSPSAQ